MKKILFVLVILGSYLFVNAQEKSEADTVIAPKVLETFTNQYKKAEISEWVIEGDSYIITFFEKNKWYDVTISKKGKWIETFIIIDFEDLPKAVSSKFESSEYADYELAKILQLDNPESKKYKLLVVNYDDNEKELVYDEKGNLLTE